MAQFYLSANNYRKDKLNRFGTQEGTFKVAIAGDGTPFGKDDRALAWLVSFRTHRFSVTLSFTPKHSSDRKKVPSDERLGAKLRVTENRCVLFDSFTYIYPALLPQH